MITDEEIEKIILSAFRYVIALQELIQHCINFPINKYLYEDFKEKLKKFPRMVSDKDWTDLIPTDTTLDDAIQEQNDKIKSIRASLAEIQKMQAQF